MSGNPGLDSDTTSPVGHVACGRKARGASTTKRASARVMTRSTFEATGAFRGGQCLIDERLATARATSVANPPKPDAQIIVAGHDVLGARGAAMVDNVCDFSECRLSCHSAHRGKSLILRPSAAGHPGHRLRLLSCRRAVVLPLPSCLTAKHANSCEIARNAVIPIMARSAGLTSARTDRPQVAEWESDAHSECQTFAPLLQADLVLHYRSPSAQTGGT